MTKMPKQIAGANAYWPSRLRYRGRRHEYGVAHFFSLGLRVKLKLKCALFIFAAIPLLYGCSRTPASIAGGSADLHDFSERSDGWVIDLPETASNEEVISNFFKVLLFRGGKPVNSDRVVVMDARGEVIAAVTNSVERVKSYSVSDVSSGWCGHGIVKTAFVDTDLGRMQVFFELARNHSLDTNVSGWSCRIFDAVPANARSVQE